MTERKNISVAMATYNGEKFIEFQIRSILQNCIDGDEIVISDDGSTDRTIEIIKSFGDDRIKVLDGPKKGIVKNFENAIANTKNEYIFLSDQDDIWMPEKINTIVDYFESDNQLILIQHDAVIVDENEKVLIDSFAEHRKVKRRNNKKCDKEFLSRMLYYI